MPTGYTAAVADGTIIDFPAFAMQCARAMGALVLMRDEPSDAPTQECFEPGDYHPKELARLRQELAELRAMNEDEMLAGAKADFQKEAAHHLERNQNDFLVRTRYERMLEAVKAWEPQTFEHRGMQSFMIEQLLESIRFDCRPDDEMAPEHPKPLTVQQWFEKRLAKVLEDIAYHEKSHAEEVVRVEARNAWLAALRASLEKTPDDGVAQSSPAASPI